MADLKRRELLALGVPATLAITQPARAAGQPQTIVLRDSGAFPNSRLPVLVYRGALPKDGDLAPAFEQLFEKHGWTGSWRNGLYRTHHYHSTAHEVLGVYRGQVSVRLGGPGGTLVVLAAGDVAVIPAGVAHKNEAQSDDFAVVGAYPTGTSPDMQYGKAGERPTTDATIGKLPLPEQDPVSGADGWLVRSWR